MTPTQSKAFLTVTANRYATILDVAQGLYGEDPTPAQMGTTIRVLRALVRTHHLTTTTDEYGNTLDCHHRSLK